MRRLQCLLCEQFTLFYAEAATQDAWQRRQMIVATTCCARENVRMR
jgi:uncharacterized protein YlxP (DUF503 family)